MNEHKGGRVVSLAEFRWSKHQATIDYVKTPIGSTDYRMNSYFADVGDPGAIQIVNEAQADYVRTYVQANLPLGAGIIDVVEDDVDGAEIGRCRAGVGLALDLDKLVAADVEVAGIAAITEQVGDEPEQADVLFNQRKFFHAAF